METLINYLHEESLTSPFSAELSNRGGYITFSNSGRRGDTKYFQIGLDSIITTLEDILKNLDIFSLIQDYDEKPWRDNGSQYFTDSVANANSTVQTKPLFSTLSKIIKWANRPNLNDINSDNHICIDRDTIETTINRLNEVADAFLPRTNKIITSTIDIDLGSSLKNVDKSIRAQLNCLRAMRTKPFLLLAGISGTGKSRIVKQMAFDSCPDNNELRSDLTAPGNYCLIEVKPNWHDSTELLGYGSKIGGAHYQLTSFVKFLAKAMKYPDVPFFVCLDEMNLAPVEQYFAEFLSVLESRTKIDGHIVSEPLIKASVFSNSEYEKDLKHEIFDVKIKEKDSHGIKIYEAELSEKEVSVYEELKSKGMRIPENVIVIGTVNMDETTHQFSRKVIDRAMTIEMNLPEGDPFMDFFDNGSELTYRFTPASPSLYLSTETKASEVVKVLSADNADKIEWLKREVAKLLTAINTALESTPFKVAYRVQNEIMLYFYQLWLEDKAAEWETILNTTVDQILMMKVLPRVEGDEELLERPLEDIKTFCENNNFEQATKKIAEMQRRLEKSRFTSFWP